MSRRDLSPGTIFRTPLVLALLSLTGLIGALLADGVWDWIGTALLATIIVAIAWARLGRRR